MMIRNVVFLGALIGVAAAVPALYQQNPQAFQSLVRSALQREQAVSPQMEKGAMRVSRAETETLLGKKVRISADARGHYTGHFKLNGYEVKAMVDTGATYVAINKSLATRIGLKLSAADFKYKVNTANGETRAAADVIQALQIGRIHVDNVEVVVLDDRALSETLIGVSFLNRLTRYQVENGDLLLQQ